MDARRISEALNWSIPAGSISGTAVRIHWTLPAFLILESLDARSRGGPEWGWTFALAMLTLWLIVLAHEFGHVFAARREGVPAPQVTLWILGGLAHLGEETTGGREIRIAAAGPLVNVGVLLLFVPVLLILGIQFGTHLFDPFDVSYARTADQSPPTLVQNVAYLSHKLNLIVLLFNLIPAFPMDGGRVLRGFLHPRHGYIRSTLIVTSVAYFFTGAFVIWAIFKGDFVLFLIAFFVGVTAFGIRRRIRLMGDQIEQPEGFMGYDFSMGNTSLEQSRPSREDRREERERKRIEKDKERDREIERQVDVLLDKISREGIDSLTKRERAFLEKASRRKR